MMILLNRRINTHTHPHSQTNCEVAKMRARIKHRATETVTTNQQILAKQLAGISEGAAINSTVKNLHRNIHSARQERNLLALPLNVTAIPVLPIEYQTTASGDQFLLFDSGAGVSDQIIAFASVQARQLLIESGNCYTDGTFKVCIQVLYQLYTFHAQHRGQIFP